MTWYNTTRTANTAFAISMVCLLGIALAMYWVTFSFVRAAERRQAVTLRYQQLELLLSAMKDAETGQRGYVITGEDRYLEPYQSALDYISKVQADLRDLSADAPEQRQDLETLSRQVAEKLQELAQTIVLRRDKGMEAARNVVMTDRGKRAMDAVRVTVAMMEARTVAQLKASDESVASLGRRSLWVLLAGNAAVVGLLLVSFGLLKGQVAQRQRAEEALRKSEESLRLMVGSVKDYAILMLDPDGRVLSWNEGAQRMIGYTADEIVGQHFSRFYPPRELELGKPELELGTAAAKGRFGDTGWRVRKDGSTFWANVMVACIRDASGRLLGFSKVTRDLTEQKQWEEKLQGLNDRLQQRSAELEATNKELEAFTYSVSHDLRAPLRHIDGFSKLLAETCSAELSEDAREYITLIRDSTREMGQLVDDLLNLARVGRRELSLQATGLDSLVQEAVEEQKRGAERRSIEWKVARLPFVECDPGLMRQVFSNLLSNAVKYTRPRERAVIEVGVKSDNGSPAIFVRDNGVGFSMKHVDKLFRVFQRLHRQEDFEGTGVGLATVQRIIQKHGGRVWAEAELDRGATFYFTLPS